MEQPKGRANYEPNSLAEHHEDAGPRECPNTGFATANSATGPEESGPKLRVRPELFADHYSQARLFWVSQTASEQAHIASAFVFELSKVQLPAVPPRMIANLRNVDDDLARRVAQGLGIDLPRKSKAAREPVELAASDALSIHKNMKQILNGRTVGILVNDGSSAPLLKSVRSQIEGAGGRVFVVAPR